MKLETKAVITLGEHLAYLTKISGDSFVMQTLQGIMDELESEDVLLNAIPKLQQLSNSVPSYTDAICLLGTCYRFGLAVQYDRKRAIEYYKLAADKGDAYAQLEMGRWFEFESIISSPKVLAILNSPLDDGKRSIECSELAAKYYRLAATQSRCVMN